MVFVALRSRYHPDSLYAELIMLQLTMTLAKAENDDKETGISSAKISRSTSVDAIKRTWRELHDKYLEKRDDSLIEQIRNLKLRLNLTRWMQIFGITSLLLCVLTMFLIYIDFHVFAVWVFGVALVLLILSLALLVKEIQISTRALSLHLKDIEEHLKKK